MQLREDQLEAIKQLSNGKILSGGTGSGKTLTSLGYYYIFNGGSWDWLSGKKKEYIKMSNPLNLIIITTAATRDKHGWDSEMGYFYLSQSSELNQYSNTVIVDSWNNITKYKDITNSFFIFDEQRVVGSTRNPWVKAFLQICKNNHWILLSATPGDNWKDYIPIFIANGFLRNQTEFYSNYAITNPHVPYLSIQKYVNTEDLEYFRKKILVPINFERSVEYVEENVIVPYDIQTYKQLWKTRWDFENDEPIDTISRLCFLLRKVVNSDESRITYARFYANLHSKAIIFYNYDYELDILKSTDWGEDVEVAEWNGHKHDPLPTGDKWVYLVNYSAGSEGWNCITCNTVIFYSSNYSYKTMIQAKGRIDRANTPFDKLYYYYIKSKATIDVAIGRAIRDKKKFNESAWAKK